MLQKIFNKRKGTTNKGVDYETLNIASIGINLVTDDKIKDFHISSNDEVFGAFDDIVVETKLDDEKEEIYALQLKHNDRGNLQLKKLIQPTGDFSVKKYFDSVQTLHVPKTKFILYTNRKFNFVDGTVFNLEGENFPITIKKILQSNILQLSPKINYHYKFSVVENDKHENPVRVSLYEKFFESFFLFTDQEDLTNVKRNLKKKFKTCFDGNDVECDQYVKFVTEWSLQDGKKEKLNKKWIKQAIALKVLSSRIQPLSFNFRDTQIVGQNILREAIDDFNLIIFKKQSYDEVKELWKDTKCADLNTVNIFGKKYQLSSKKIVDINEIDPLTLSILFWLMGKCPLIVIQDVNVHKVLKLCVDEKFILLKDDSVNLTKDISAFRTLSDLKIKASRYNQLVQNFKCSWQGQETCLEKIINANEGILSVIKTDDLLEMSKGLCAIGATTENLPESYIGRRLLKNKIDFKTLENITKETVVILDSVPQTNDLKNKLKSHNLINIHDYLSVEKDPTSLINNIETNTDEKSQTEYSSLSTTIYLSEERCKYSEFNAICNESQNVKNVHQFRVRDDGNLEWIRSKGDVSDLEKYKLSEYYEIQEQDLASSKCENNINLLVSDPGMGKSELMKSLKINCFSEFVTVSIDPKDVYSFLRNPHDNDSDNYEYVNAFKTFLLDEKYKQFSARDKEIFRIFLNKNKIIYVWDALDELSNDHRNIVIDMIVELSETCVQWVTSRCHLQTQLQKKFSVLSLNLNKFDKDEQKKYIQQRLSGDDEDSIGQIDVIIEKLGSSFFLIEHKDILGIPLQLFMLTELIRQDQKKYLALLNNVFVLSDLYNYFIEEKINMFILINFPVQNTEYTKNLAKSQKEKILEEYTNAALRLLFPEFFKELTVQNRDISEAIDESHRNIGLVTEIKDQIPRFLHNSFAEHLAARYFASKLEHKEVLAQVMFDPKYDNVRFFFDLLLAKNSEAHVAILYRNFSFIKDYDSKMLTKIDLGGRSPLHLACSWGQRYPELNVKYVGDTYIIDDDGKFSTVPDKQEYLETIDCLIEKCDSSTSDETYKMTPAEYARKTTCMGAQMRIMMKETTNKLIDIDHIINLLYYSAHYGYHYEFSIFAFELLVQIERNGAINKLSCRIIANVKNNTGMTLLYIAASMGRVKIVELLVKAGADVNCQNIDGFTPLNAASANGHYKVVEFLVKTGADINLANKYGFTPLISAFDKEHYQIIEFLLEAGAGIDFQNKDGLTPLVAACEKGHYKIVEFLVEKNADVNRPNKDGFTPLIAASWNGHDKIVKLLVKAGADPNLVNKDGVTPLNAASSHGHYEVVEILVQEDAEINLANKNGSTPLFIACLQGHDKIAEFLVRTGADINLADKDGWTPLIAASVKGYLKIVRLLVEADANINLANKQGNTPLQISSQKGHKHIVHFLLKAKSDINLANKDGNTPLRTASEKGHKEIVKFLITAGASINLRNKRGNTALHAASKKGHYKIVKILVSAGADIHLANKDGLTPLIAASSNGCFKIFKFLITRGADINVANKRGNTPLQTASRNGQEKIVEFLTKAGADVNLANNDGVTPLIAASMNGDHKIFELLVRAGADINLADRDGLTPLIAAASNGHYRIVEALVRRRVGVNLADENGFTPLSAASEKGHGKIVRFLLRSGADVNLANRDHLTPLHLAAYYGHKEVVVELVEAGADFSCGGKYGMMPLDLAEMGQQDDIVTLLRESGAPEKFVKVLENAKRSRIK